MVTYRKQHGSDTWHWCRNCSKWPLTGYIERHSAARPTVGELCNECLAKDRVGDCIKQYSG